MSKPTAGDESTTRNWAMISHMSALTGLIIPLGHILGPLVVWLWKKKEMKLVDKHGCEALNFQISMTIYFFIAGILVFILIGYLLLIILTFLDLVLMIRAAMAASRGEDYRYPFSLRLVNRKDLDL